MYFSVNGDVWGINLNFSQNSELPTQLPRPKQSGDVMKLLSVEPPEAPDSKLSSQPSVSTAVRTISLGGKTIRRAVAEGN